MLFSLDVLRSRKERSIVACMAVMLFIGTAASFLLPLYMQVVQGLSGFQTSLSIVPYTLSIFVANTQVSRLYDRFSPAAITRVSFLVVFVALTLLAFTIRNDWSQVVVVAGLVTVGIAVGTAIAVSLLGTLVARDALATPAFSDELIEQVNFDNTEFITSDRLELVLEERGSTPAETEAAVRRPAS